MKEVSKSIYRSARPTYEELKAYGFKTVINLEDDDEAIEQERRWCGELRTIFIPYGLSEITRPKKYILKFIVDGIQGSIKPVLVHCKHGHERTGIVTAYYRIKVEGWSKWKAIKEALKEGFSPFYLWWFL